MCLNKKDSEYSLGPTCAKILNMAKFWISHGSQYASITQPSEYARICLDRILNISWVLSWVLEIIIAFNYFAKNSILNL